MRPRRTHSTPKVATGGTLGVPQPSRSARSLFCACVLYDRCDGGDRDRLARLRRFVASAGRCWIPRTFAEQRCAFVQRLTSDNAEGIFREAPLRARDDEQLALAAVPQLKPKLELCPPNPPMSQRHSTSSAIAMISCVSWRTPKAYRSHFAFLQDVVTRQSTQLLYKSGCERVGPIYHRIG